MMEIHTDTVEMVNLSIITLLSVVSSLALASESDPVNLKELELPFPPYWAFYSALNHRYPWRHLSNMGAPCEQSPRSP